MQKMIKATENHIKDIYNLVQETIQTIYPKYYPIGVVEFFSQHHSIKNITTDVKLGNTSLLFQDNQLVATGTIVTNHITRLFVLPAFQKQGLGRYIMKQFENEIFKTYDSVILDASLPARNMYEKRGYVTLTHEKIITENGDVLIYEVMKKEKQTHTTQISYNGKIFIPKMNSENGEVDEHSIFYYHQNDNLLWAEYEGGDVLKGSLIGTVSENGELTFHYQHLNKKMEVRIGKCHSTPHILENGKIELHEVWQWLNGDLSKGTSVLIEK